MFLSRLRILSTRALALCLMAAAGGCVGLQGGNEQLLEVHTILGHREVAGVGCVLSNSAGRWFVVAPGRVTVVRTRDPLNVDCAREGLGDAREAVAARADARFDANKLIGNIVVRTPLDSYFDRQSGAGVAYPAMLTVLMRSSAAPMVGDGTNAGNVVF
jgi:hypothetical protein